MRPPTRVHLWWGNTAPISATFGQGAPHPPGGFGTSMVARSATETSQRPVEGVETDPTLADVEGLGEI